MPLAGSTVGLRLPVEVPDRGRTRDRVPAGHALDPARRHRASRPSRCRATIRRPARAGSPAASRRSSPRESSAIAGWTCPAATVAGSEVTASVTLPGEPGRYRLEVTLHDRDGVALPYAVQASIPGVVVHVGGPGAAWLDAPPTLSVVAGTLTSIQVVATNGEATAWGELRARDADFGPDDRGDCPTVRLVGRWVAITGAGTAAPISRELVVPAATAPTTWLAGTVPAEPGTYLLVASLERSSGGGPAAGAGPPDHDHRPGHQRAAPAHTGRHLTADAAPDPAGRPGIPRDRAGAAGAPSVAISPCLPAASASSAMPTPVEVRAAPPVGRPTEARRWSGTAHRGVLSGRPRVRPGASIDALLHWGRRAP